MWQWTGRVGRWALLLLLCASVAHFAFGYTMNILVVVCNQFYAHALNGRMVFGIDVSRRIAPTTYYQVLGPAAQSPWHAEFEYEVPPGGGWIRMSIPLWVAPSLFVIACTSAWWPHLRRRQKGGCRGCGYSMAGLTAGAACPECGASLARVATEKR